MFHLLGRLLWEMAVRPHLIVLDLVFSRREKGKARADRRFVALAVAAHFLLGIARSSSPLFDHCRSQILDFAIAAADLFAVADPGPVAVAVAVLVAAAAVLFVGLAAIADSAGPVCSSAAAKVKARAAVVVVSCFSVPRSSFLHNHSSLLPLYSPVQT